MARLIEDKYEQHKAETNARFDQLKANEEELNRIFAEIYGMVGEVPIEVEDKYVSVARIFDTAEEIPEIIEDDLDAYVPETTTTTTTTTAVYYEPEPVFEIEDSYDDQPEQSDYSDYTDYGISVDEGGYDGGEQQDYTDSGSSETAAGGDAATVIEYAKGMVGGSYVWAGEQYGATDCSGLVMLSYAQIGINLPHLASMQAEYGSDVARSDIQPGDLVFFGYGDYSSIYHVAMYIGDGKIVHAESTDTGIVISYLDSVAQYNNITCIKRLI